MELDELKNTKITTDILHAVTRPVRYVGGEFGSIIKTEQEVNVSFALAFPDTYEVGMSYLGFKILYHILNCEQGICAERIYAPWVDMESKMRAADITLASLETGRALSDFDLVGFTLQYELSYTNILNMLDLGKIPLLVQDRTLDDPFVVGGGPCVYNPEPLADFFDLFIIGEGEEIIVELARCLEEWKAQGKTGGRLGFLQLAAKLEGIYVPEFYLVRYKQQDVFCQPNRADIPKVINKRIIADMDGVNYPNAPIVPFGDIVHDRIMLEVFRGCTRGCRFCHAGMVYRPVRERSLEVLKKLALEQVANTGYNEISLVSLSTADYSCLLPLIEDLTVALKNEKVSVSLPSLRIDSFSLDLAKKVQAVRKSSLTFAPEAGSQRMRDVINKNVSEENLLEAVGAAFSNGWSTIKLYFMIGLPTETDEDIKAIADLAYKVLDKYREIKNRRGAKVVISVSNFVPKPYTPFQWEPQNTIEELSRKHLLLRDALRNKDINYQYHDSCTSILEGVFARGDRRLGKVLLHAWKNGAKFDGWSEHFSFAIWQEAFVATGIDYEQYIYRRRLKEENFAWEHISPRVSKEFLRCELEKSYAASLTEDCRWGACSVCGACQ